MTSSRVAVIGAGYVGLTTAACLASLGHRVRCADRDAALVGRLLRGKVDIMEPQLDILVAEGLAAGRLLFEVSAPDAVADAEAVFLCLPTPAGHAGAPDVSAVMAVSAQIAGALPNRSTVVIKSTVPPGTAGRVAALVGRPDVAVVSNPEFLREGMAVTDFQRPDRIVVGCDNSAVAAAERIAGLYTKVAAPVVLTSTISAELAKYAANSFLAVKLSFVNEVAELCERTGADIGEVTQVLGHDPRIGESYMRPGPGWGGPCLPKDTQALLHIGAVAGSELEVLRAAVADNQRQQRSIVGRARLAVGGSLIGARIALLGLAFKTGTGDLRDSPAIAVAELLAAEQAQVTGYDPAVRGSVARVRVADNPYEAVTCADAVVVLTDWPQFRELDWERVGQIMAGDTVIDTRNHLDPAALDRAGLRWHGVGRGHLRNGHQSTSLRVDREVSGPGPMADGLAATLTPRQSQDLGATATAPLPCWNPGSPVSGDSHR
jgi:UDPglucose 6-dehydrogenase